jgi:uncharacterized membrane protein
MNWNFEFDFGIGGLLAVLRLCAVYAIVVLRRINAAKSFAGRILIVSAFLHLPAFSLLAVLLLKPEIILKKDLLEKPEIVILADISESMDTSDIAAEEGIISRRKWLEKILKNKPYSLLYDKYDITVKPFASSSSDEKSPEFRSETDIGSALAKAVGERTRSIIIASDGCQNNGPPPVRKSAELALRGIKVHTILAGENKYLPDIELGDLFIPSYCIVNERLSIPYSVHNKFGNSITTRLKWGISPDFTTDEITIEPHSTFRGTLLWKPEKKGNFKLSFSIPPQEGESDLKNNELSKNIEVRDEKLKVLLIDSLPRWEFRYLKNALTRDPGVRAEFMLFLPNIGMGEGKGYRNQFPNRDEISSFDVIFIGDAGRNELTDENLKLVKDAVEKNASGLVIMPGKQGSFASLENSPIEDLIPVKSDKTRTIGISSAHETAIELTSYGMGHHLAMLADNPSSNLALWRALPGFTWNWAVESLKAGSRVIAVHSSARNSDGRMPVIVEKNYGAGIVLFMGSDHVWKWRKGVEDKYHYRFWGQVVRWMSHKRHLGNNDRARIFYEPENPRVGSEITLNVLISEKIKNFSSDELLVSVTNQSDGQSESFRMSKDKSDPRLFKGSFTPSRKGAHSLSIGTNSIPKIAEISFEAKSAKTEKKGDPANEETMKAISNAGGGYFAAYKDANTLFSKISEENIAAQEEKRLKLWSNPWIVSGIIILFASGWSLRKIAGAL